MAPRQLATPLLALGLTLVTSGIRAHAQSRAVTLDEALRRAELVDPQVAEAQGNVRNAGASIRAAFGTYLPTFQTSANFSNSFSEGESRLDPITGEVISGNRSSTGLNFGANASYDLFTGFRRGKDISSARAQRASAEASLDYERAQNRLRTTRTFVDAIQSAALVRVRRESIRRAEEQFRIAVAKLATRSVNVDDSLQASVNVAQAQLQLLSDEQQLEANEAALGRAIGEVGRVTAQADSSLSRVASIADTAALIAEVEARAPEVLRTAAAERAARANLGAVKSGYFPSLNLSASTQFAGSASEYQLLSSRSVGLGLSWQVFNRFQRELQIAQRRSDLATAETQSSDTRRRVIADMIGRLAGLRAAEARYRIAQANVETLRALVRVKLERYRIGSIDADLLSRTQEQLNNAEAEAVRAQYDYVVRKAEIEAVLGRAL
jgi:outer membrane protein TolC